MKCCAARICAASLSVSHRLLPSVLLPLVDLPLVCAHGRQTLPSAGGGGGGRVGVPGEFELTDCTRTCALAGHAAAAGQRCQGHPCYGCDSGGGSCYGRFKRACARGDRPTCSPVITCRLYTCGAVARASFWNCVCGYWGGVGCAFAITTALTAAIFICLLIRNSWCWQRRE